MPTTTPRKTCRVVGEICTRPVTARGLCRKHYLREYRAGTHTTRPTRSDRTQKRCPPEHPHDVDTCWTQHGCRCEICVYARSMERKRRRNRLRAQGADDQIVPELVPAAAARAHVQQLHELGLGYERIGLAAGVGPGPMMDLIYGPRGAERGRGPAVSIRKEYAVALLALTVDDIEFALVDPTGTVRRLRALVAIGWNETTLAESLGMTVGNFWGLLHNHRGRVTSATRDKVTTLFTRVWDQPQHGGWSERARRIAKHYRWVGPLAWDDIDDPDGLPDGVPNAKDRRSGAAEYLEDIAFLLELGESPHQAALIVGRTLSTIAKAAERHGQDEVRAVFEKAMNKRIAA